MTASIVFPNIFGPEVVTIPAVPEKRFPHVFITDIKLTTKDVPTTADPHAVEQINEVEFQPYNQETKERYPRKDRNRKLSYNVWQEIDRLPRLKAAVGEQLAVHTLMLRESVLLKERENIIDPVALQTLDAELAQIRRDLGVQ